MKNYNLIKRLFTDSHEKQSPQRFGRYAAILIMLFTLGVGQARADWFVRGEGTGLNNWGDGTKMNTSSNANVFYLEVSGYCAFKITTAKDNWDAKTTINNELGNLTSLSGGNGNNITGGNSGETWYICYDSSEDRVYGVMARNITGTNPPCSSAWATSSDKMTFDGYHTFTKSFTYSSLSQTDFKITRYNGNYSDAITGNSGATLSGVNCTGPADDGSNNHNIRFTPYVTGTVTITYNYSDNKVTVTCPKIPVTFDKQSGTGGSNSVNADYGAAMPAMTKPSRDGYSFQGYYASAGGSGTQYYYYNGSSAHNWDQTSATTIYANWALKRTITMYYAAPADVVACNTVKCYVDYGYDQGTQDLTMTKTDYTYGGKPIYSIEVTANYDGFDEIYFKPKGTSGSGSEEQTGCNSRTSASSLSGKMFVHGSGWTTYSKDASYTVYFVNQNSWATPKAYAWNSECDYNAAYATSGTMTNTGKTYNGKAIWSITFNKRFSKIIFNSNASESVKTGNLDCYSNAGKLFTFANSTTSWITYTYDVAVTLHDNNGGSHNGSANVHYLSGTSFVSKTAPTKTGYTVEGYYKEAETTNKIATAAGALQTSTAYTNSSRQWSSGAQTLYAGWTANNYTITLHEQGATTSGTPGDEGTISVTYDATTNLSKITAVPERTGYTFGGYYDTEECDGSWIIKDDTYFNWDGTYLNSSTGVWKYDGNVDLYAKWTANEYTVTFDVDEANKGTTASATTSQDIYYDDATVTVPNLPTAANGYKFDGYYTEQLGEGTKVINANGTWIASITGYTDASKHWVHAGNVTLYAYYKKAEITALTLDATVVETNATVGLTPTISPTPEGDTKLCFYVFHSNDNPLDPQPSISWNGTKATFNAGETSGTYKIGVALRTGTECGGGTLLDSTTVSYQVAGTHSVTVRYKCGDDVIKAATTLEGIRPLDWSDKIGAPEITGYKFTGWTAGDGVTLTDDGGTTTATSSSKDTIKIKAIYDGYLTAKYAKKRVIYFNNTLGWDTVYVYFYKNDSYWDDAKGTGAQTTKTYTNTPYSEGLHGGMKRVSPGSNIWYFDAEAAGVNASYLNVAFTNKDQHGYEFFYGDVNVVKRGDYYSTKLPLFVPIATQTPEEKNSNNAHYYFKGYWMNYPENTGYTLKIYNQKEQDGAVELKSIPFEFSADYAMPMELNVDLEAGQTYGFKIWRNDGLNAGAGSFYGNTGTMTGNTEGWAIYDDVGSNTGLQTTAAGNYKFLLNFYEISTDYQYRVSVTYPVASGDYRLVYKDNVQTKEFKSAIIPKASAKDTVSFFVRKGQSANLKLQKCTGLGVGTVTWTDTVTWWSGSTIHAAVTQDSVYNICLKHNASTGKLEIENVEAYTGNYYIRVDAANSKWDNYRTDPDHLMTYSEYSITHGGYSHYYTHWIQTDDRKNVKFVIANDYSPNISDTLARETASGAWTNITNYIESNGDLTRNANVRFMWNRHDNTIKRAYVDGAQEDGSQFLVMLNTDSPSDKIRWSEESALTDHKVTFSDNGNWIYEANIEAQPNAQIQLKSTWGTENTITQYFKGTSSTSEALISGSSEDWYDIRVIYDFKTNRLLASWIPSGKINDTIEINADVMFIREHQDDIAQLTFGDDGAISDIKTAYGVLRLNKWTLNNKKTAVNGSGGHDPLDEPLSRYERDLFYVSFPFRVSMEEVFGFGKYGTHWIIEYYDGANRAANGYWLESGPNWKFVTNRKDKFFEPNQGYIIALDLDELGESSSVWANTEQVELYFPSYGTMSDITNASVNCTIPEHLCTINRSEEIGGGGVPLGSAYDRRVKDSHWNVISVPTYVNTSNLTFANTEWITTADDEHVGPNFLYEWNPNDNSVTARSGVGYTYQAMHAYLVQYCGIITWTSSVSPAAAPRRNPAYRGEYEFRLELQQNDVTVDQTYVKLSDNENVTTGFEFNYDLSKEFNASKSNIYTLIGTEQAAGNVLPLTNQTTIVPVGVKVIANGDYTFSIPDGTEGIGVTLIDNETGIRTSLSALDYTVNLSAGTYDNRFMLEISPIKPVPTNVELVNGENGENGVRKMMIDGLLYIVKDGKMFDARGARVQ